MIGQCGSHDLLNWSIIDNCGGKKKKTVDKTSYVLLSSKDENRNHNSLLLIYILRNIWKPMITFTPRRFTFSDRLLQTTIFLIHSVCL